MKSTMRYRMNAVSYFFLNLISDKFDVVALKRLTAYLFAFSEKILIYFPKFRHIYIDYYDDIINHEIKIASIQKTANILHVGCGSIPASCILLAEKLGTHVIGIDKDEEIINYATICKKNNELTNKIKIKRMDISEMNLSLFDVILISQGIFPKQQFLEDLSEKISCEQSIIFRTYSKNGELDEQDQFIKKYYNIIDIFHHTNHGSTISVFMKKKEF